MLPPPITIEQLRARAGIADDSKDAELEAAFGIAFDMLESYLDRALMLAADTLTEAGKPATVNVRRWPIVSIESVTWNGQAASVGSYWFDAAAGEILFAWPRGCAPLVINWTGGFAELPPVLAWAALAVFDQVWINEPGYGGTGQGGIADAGAQKISVVGVGSLDYGSASGGVMGSSSNPWAMIPASVCEAIDGYRNHARYGGA